MKAKPIAILQDIENDPDLVVGHKYNGFSEKMVIRDGKIRLFTRSGAEHTENVPHLTKIEVPESLDLVLVGEGISLTDRVEEAKSIFGSNPPYAIEWQRKHGPAQFIAVNITRFNGEDLSHIPFAERLPLLESQYENLRFVYRMGDIRKEDLYSTGKKQFFDTVVARGGEGVVVKKLSGTEKDWFKVKKINSWDAVIIGFTQGKRKYKDVVGAIRYGFFTLDGQLKEVGKCSGMTDADRKMFAANPESFIGRCFEVRGQEFGSRGGIIFPRFIRMRDDKTPYECQMPLEDMRK